MRGHRCSRSLFSQVDWRRLKVGVSDHGIPLDLANGKWVSIFLNAVGEAQIRREGYLCSRAANGDLACKACGCYLPAVTPMAAHFEEHLVELDAYLAKRAIQREEHRQDNLEKAREVRRQAKLTASEQVDEFLVI